MRKRATPKVHWARQRLPELIAAILWQYAQFYQENTRLVYSSWKLRQQSGEVNTIRQA